MLSFVIPAHNEEDHIGPTIAAVMAAARQSGESFEVIVVDDASTDGTAAIAAEYGARIIHVEHRQIAATRNAGARAACGDVFFFVDADTLANPEAVCACLRELQKGAVGGGCVFRFDGVLPLWARVLYPVAVVLSRLLKLVGGCFLFCTREAFFEVGGFCERYFAAEEAAFIRALKRRGPFAVPGPTVVTSGRKLRANSFWRIVREAWRWMIRGPESYLRREGLELWYGERAGDESARTAADSASGSSPRQAFEDS
jgi:glycosyltransferase involved in cell wall biosynthesis